MENSTENAQHLWQVVEEHIGLWLKERQELLVRYSVFGLNEAQASRHLWADVSGFFQQLMDYMSKGHFEIYRELVEEAEAFADPATDLAEGLYPELAQATSVAVEFNEKYANEEQWENNQTSFTKDISELGEILSDRFEKEDVLIAFLHDSHRPRDSE